MDGSERVLGNRYRLLRILGSGGMAEVWLAADQRLGDKQVAVKRLLGFEDGRVDAVDIERARREALAASRLDHPNLVSVTDFVADDGEPFIVMEFVDGTTLDDLIGTTGIAPNRAARLLGQVAAALAEAHEAGIIHRDIKPANIMVTRRDNAKLADFGIARSAGDSRLTHAGFFTGTAAFLAPELLDGSDATSASDVWALGAVLFEALEGRHAFGGDSTAAVIAAIAFNELPRSTRAPQLTPVIDLMLRREPSERMKIEEVADRLSAIGSAPPTTTRPAEPDLSERETIRLDAPLTGAPGGFTAPPAPTAPTAPATQPAPAAPAARPAAQPGPHEPRPYHPQQQPGPHEPRPYHLDQAHDQHRQANQGGGPPHQSQGNSGPLPFVQPKPSNSNRGKLVAVSIVVLLLVVALVVYLATRGDDSGGSPNGKNSGGAAAPPGSTSGSPAASAGPLRVLAHRGGREKFAEQSVPAFTAAARAGYGVETDVRWTSDDVAVLVHDPTTEANLECDGGPYTVADITLKTLQSKCRTPADASPDGKSYPPPTLEDAAKALSKIPGARIFPEVKVDQTTKQVSGFLSILNRYQLLDNAVVTSFKPAELVKMRQGSKPFGTTLKLMLILGTGKTATVEQVRDADATWVAVELQAATKRYLGELDQAGITTVGYLANTADDWAKLRRNKATYVMSDVPAAYLKWLAAR